jgi:hypothetical protein
MRCDFKSKNFLFKIAMEADRVGMNGIKELDAVRLVVMN